MAKEYFSDLNYTLANEDTRVEQTLLKENSNKVFSIAGSGARCLPLIAKNPKDLFIIDMSEYQIFLCELRFEAMRQLNYAEWLFFMGYRGALQSSSPESDHGDHRWDLFKKLKLQPKTETYWSTHRKAWEPRGFILLGKWESHFQKLGVIFRDYLKCDFSVIFKAETLAEQIELYEKHWPQLRWKSFLRLLASEYVFNKYLYKGHFSGSSGHKTESRPPYQFVWEEFERIFRTQLVRKNYFMQVLLLGGIMYEEGLPLEAHESTFQAVKKSTTTIHYHVGNLLDLLPKNDYDFVSLSDTISYLSKDDANQILQKMNPNTKSGSRIVIRSFLRAPTEIDLKGWTQLKDQEKWAHQTDGTSVYNFHIYQKN